MKNLDEMKLLARMARNLGQPDLDLENRIKLEENLNKRLFAKPKEPPVQILKEELPPAPAPAFEPPKKDDIIQQTVNAISSPKFAKQELPDFQQKELDGIRKQIAEIIQRMGTLSWGGGGTGAVKINDMDDLDRSTLGPGKYMTWNNGTFYLDDINTTEVVYNTTLVTTATYTAQSGDYYIGVNYGGTVTITLPTIASSGRNLVIKDESGNCENNAITIVGTIDNDAGGVILQINNGAIDLIFRDGWRII
jgi:hypothetical protein